jgi:hypothetical protein
MCALQELRPPLLHHGVCESQSGAVKPRRENGDVGDTPYLRHGRDEADVDAMKVYCTTRRRRGSGLSPLVSALTP